MKFLREVLNVKVSKAKLESLTNIGIQDISHELFQSGIISFSSPEERIIEDEKRSFYFDMAKSLSQDLEYISSAQNFKRQKIALRERVMGAIRCSVLGSIVKDKLSDGVPLKELKSAFDELEFWFPFGDKESVKKITVLGFVKEGALFEVRNYLGDAHSGDWAQMYRFMFENMIEQTISTYLLRKSDSDCLLDKHYQREFNKLTDKINAHEYVYNEVMNGGNFKFNKNDAENLA
ncbi:hypothetical protein VISI1226_10109 [Vibrio sinaloensis DSM 21326]|uniref:Uncharacterized protein n=1 Tax=Vibrio sinaloensis DSM 21326 TaxID=945550 RepID=E8M890_PHOS4|nr:hypothetical protein [Vibrio sinaloensis]EGA69782.1 hypothetical protein VISI1226_10109 [Vibrio sinaloensis DSM 21326]